MAFTNSKLISYTKISPNRTKNRNHAIDTISIHCVCGQCSVETLGSIFASPSKEASCNYGIGYDGRIGMYVEEKDRSWCTSSPSNDHRAITIEVASDTKHPYAVNDKAYKALIELLVDICQRNNIKELKWKGDKSLIGQVDKQNMTVHQWFANKSCPGEYLYSRHGKIAAAVNARLGVKEPAKKEEKPVVKKEEKVETKTYPKVPFTVQVLIDDLNYRENPSMSGEVKGQTGKGIFTITKVSNSWGKLKSGEGWIWLENNDYCKILKTVVEEKVETKKEENKDFTVRVSITNLNIRKGPGTNYGVTGNFTGRGVFTIVETKTGKGSTKGWGKLKSGEGWICLDYTTRI